MCQVYGRIYRVVEPKRARLHGAMTQLAEKQASLAEAQGKLREVMLSIYPELCYPVPKPSVLPTKTAFRGIIGMVQ